MLKAESQSQKKFGEDVCLIVFAIYLCNVKFTRNDFFSEMMPYNGNVCYL